MLTIIFWFAVVGYVISYLAVAFSAPRLSLKNVLVAFPLAILAILYLIAIVARATGEYFEEQTEEFGDWLSGFADYD